MIKITVGIDLEKVRRIAKAIHIMPNVIIHEPTLQAMDYAWYIAKTYPPVPAISRAAVYGTAFKTSKQRKKFFADIIHQTPYHRTYVLQRNWHRHWISEGLIGEVYNRIAYSKYVQGENQSLYMAYVGWLNMNMIKQFSESYWIKVTNDAMYRALSMVESA